MKRQTNLAQTIDLVFQRARYDECAKKLLTYKAIIAWILKFCAKEFSPYSVHYICENCLKEKPEISKYAVHQDHKDQDERLDGVDQTAYDLMEVVVLNLGDAEENSQQEVLNLLNILFSVNVTPVEKKRRLQEEFSIAMTREFEGEVENMCNLSQGLVEYGIERGIERGMKRGIEKGELKKAREVAISLAETGMPVEKISELVKVSVKIVCEWLAEKS